MKWGAYERTNLSRLTQLEFLGLYVMMRLNRMWAAGANPLEELVNNDGPADRAGETYIGAPGWPELALKVASTCTAGKESALGALRWGEKPALRFGLRMAGQQTTAGRWGEGKPEGSGTHGQESNCVDGQLVKVGVGHDGREENWAR
jgi:hypothetical protein